VEKVIKFWHGV